ncbi:MAG: hypothetical protein JST92_15535 [Deltaproteobacteria bacterium]|nr:hypothetical protein [Deltaproteobacteria bacterium]
MTIRHCTLALAAAALVATGCGSNKSNPPAGPSGGVNLKFKSASNALTIGVPDLCPTFTLTPYSISSGTYTAAGDPITVQETHPGQTEFIAGCVDTSDNTATPPANDWSYAVSASGWAFCGSFATPADLAAAGYNDLADYLTAHNMTLADFFATISPQTAVGQLDFNCVAGKDVNASISVDVSITFQSSAGYVDISVSVNTHEVSIGCKMADFDQHAGDGSIINFGAAQTDQQSNLTNYTVGLSGQLSPTGQFHDEIHSGGDYTQTDTGQLGAPTAASQILQTFESACTQGTVFHGTLVPTCDTEIPGDGSAPSTSAQLTSAFISSDGDGECWANLAADGSAVTLTTATTNASEAPGATPGSFSAYNNTTSQTIAAPSGTTIDGIWPDGQSAFGFVIAYHNTSGVQAWATLTFDPTSGAWAPGAPKGNISGLTSDQIACLGLFGQGATGCTTPKDCGIKADVVCNELTYSRQTAALIAQLNATYNVNGTNFDFATVVHQLYPLQSWSASCACFPAYQTYLLNFAADNSGSLENALAFADFQKQGMCSATAGTR